MKIISGLFDKMVLQRNKQDECEAIIKGEFLGKFKAGFKDGLNGAGKLSVKVSGQKDFKVKQEAYNFNGTITSFEINLKGLAVGGPYSITIKASKEEIITVKDVLVGDVWILAGQSNMSGAGLLKTDTSTPLKTIRNFSNLKGTWDIAKNPLTQWEGEDFTQPIGVGPGLPYAIEMFDFYGVPQGLIPCARGGTSMDQWSPELKNDVTSFYGNMFHRFELAGGKVAGMLWDQGCNDAGSELAYSYFDKMVNFIASLRSDFNLPNLPVVIGQMSRVGGGVYGNPVFWNIVQDAQRRLPDAIKNLLTVPTIDIELEDRVHFSSKGQAIFGERYFTAMRVLIDKDCTLKPPIQFRSYKIVESEIDSRFMVELSFSNVTGNLYSKGHPNGFDINLGDGPLDTYRVYRIELKGKKVCLLIDEKYSIFEEGKTLNLYYGYGIWPYCNIFDHADNPLPVFGPIKLQLDTDIKNSMQ